MTAPAEIRVVLADDHPALRVGLRVLLDREADIRVVAEADDGSAALDVTAALSPDVIVLDCQLPGLDGVAVAAEIRRRALATHVLALSAYDDDRYIAEMYQAGAAGYLLKSEAPGEIVSAVRYIAQGGELWSAHQLARADRWRDSSAAARTVRRFRSGGAARPNP